MANIFKKLRTFAARIPDLSPIAGLGSPMPGPSDTRPQVPFKQGATMGVRYEPSNITQFATAEEIQNAIREAERGNTMNLFRFYRDISFDSHIQAEINARKLALLAQPLAIMPKDKNNVDDVALAVAFARAKADCENWRDGMNAMMDSNCGWPVAVLERIMQPAKDPRPDEPQLQFTLKRLVPVNPQVFCYQWAYFSGSNGTGTASAIQQIQTTANGQNADANPYVMDLNRWEPYLKLWPIDENGRIVYDDARAAYLDPARHFVHRGHLLTTFRDNWGGPMRAILFWWYFRNLGREWFAKFMERFGMPFPVGYTDATDAAAVALLREAFELGKTIGGLVVDENCRVELKEAMVAGGAEGHAKFRDICNSEISKLITGLDASSKPGGLNAGADNMQQNVREDYRMFDQQSLAESVITGIVKPFADMNGLKGEIKLVWGGFSVQEAKAFADFLAQMNTAGWTPTDDAVPVIEERTGIPFQRAQAPAALGAGNEDGGSRMANGKVKPKADEEDPKTFSARLKWLSSASTAESPVEDVVREHQAALARAFRGSMAPVRQIILNSSSQAEAEHQLKLFFADWDPERIAGIVEQAMQICAAKGAAQAGK